MAPPATKRSQKSKDDNVEKKKNTGLRESSSRGKNKAASIQDREKSVSGKSNSESDEVQEVVELDSDALDDVDINQYAVSNSSKKRKRARAAEKRKSPSKKPKKKKDIDSEDQFSDEERVTVVGNVVQAPTEGRVPPGQISQNTFNFLKNLAKPECNDHLLRRLLPFVDASLQEWKAWIEAFTPLLIEIDDQIPELPPQDVLHRIYRDIRFSNDKTPYKLGFSASFSRTGRKGIFAHYHVCVFLRIFVHCYFTADDKNFDSAVSPNGRSLVAAGAWQPGRNELSTMRHHIQHDPSRLRNIISDPEFIKIFGEPWPHPEGERQSIFGSEDELKTAPKGIDKNHKDIDLLKLRSVAVFHHFLDSEVIAPDFMEQVCKVIKLTRPLVHCLNDIMTLPPDESESEDAGEQDG
ncbi:hypothetical protein Clacol_008924 [Clathrus columnatus]|uniref:Uncharacterized protein n=1 Tax=Clathrus columnatus TaxID=1419009 RepID=A0AAV5AMD5_9AGAM|nr:hypothetical protein Clacol_008924 [Clathrus columnatus]